jgi:hypothetical protein
MDTQFFKILFKKNCAERSGWRRLGGAIKKPAGFAPPKRAGISSNYPNNSRSFAAL